MADDRLSLVFGALADPVRRAILTRLSEGEATVGELAAPFAISQPAVSKHLKVLREAGLVRCRTAGQHRLYRVDPQPLREVDEWLAPYRRQWADHLNALERHLQIMEASEEGSWA
jgi:DNA-binding transcriptional ArsR family regulator